VPVTTTTTATGGGAAAKATGGGDASSKKAGGGVSAAAKKGLAALLNASKTGELERIVASAPIVEEGPEAVRRGEKFVVDSSKTPKLVVVRWGGDGEGTGRQQKRSEDIGCWMVDGSGEGVLRGEGG
jgi:hypothetical protein